jgi:hypothetical protein
LAEEKNVHQPDIFRRAPLTPGARPTAVIFIHGMPSAGGTPA